MSSDHQTGQEQAFYPQTVAVISFTVWVYGSIFWLDTNQYGQHSRFETNTSISLEQDFPNTFGVFEVVNLPRVGAVALRTPTTELPPKPPTEI
jgi:hypothetical protein